MIACSAGSVQVRKSNGRSQPGPEMPQTPRRDCRRGATRHFLYKSGPCCDAATRKTTRELSHAWHTCKGHAADPLLKQGEMLLATHDPFKATRRDKRHRNNTGSATVAAECIDRRHSGRQRCCCNALQSSAGNATESGEADRQVLEHLPWHGHGLLLYRSMPRACRVKWHDAGHAI